MKFDVREKEPLSETIQQNLYFELLFKKGKGSIIFKGVHFCNEYEYIHKIQLVTVVDSFF